MDRYPASGAHVPSVGERNRVFRSLIDAGWGHRIMLGHDWDSSVGLYSDRARSERDAVNPDRYLFITRRVVPDLKALGATDIDVRRLMVGNPRRFVEGRA